MRATLLIGPDSAYQRKLHDQTKDRTNELVAPSGSELTQLLLSPEPEIVLAKILADQLSLTQLSPYQLGGGVNRESVFFGRQEIISHIMNRDPANYLVVSGRQLGKSSLLKALARRYLERPDITCRYLALSSEVLVPRLAAELGLPQETELEKIAAHLAERKGRFLFLIDEADKFVRFERKTDYQILDVLRRMSEEGHCAFIIGRLLGAVRTCSAGLSVSAEKFCRSCADRGVGNRGLPPACNPADAKHAVGVRLPGSGGSVA